MLQWKRDVVKFRIINNWYYSVPFTWILKDAIKQANMEKTKTYIGGPAVSLMRDYVQEHIKKHVHIAEEIPGIEPVTAHNPFATFTTRGCINKCKFCAVPVIEGEFKEIKKFIPRPIVCDNNFLAASDIHFNRAVDKLKDMPFVCFNQALDCQLFKGSRASRLQELKIPVMHFAFDNIKKESDVVTAIRLARKKGFKTIGILMLYGFQHTIDESVHMGEVLRKEKVRIYPMRYHPLDSLTRKGFVNKNKGWTEDLLQAFQRCYYCTDVPFHEFKNQVTMIVNKESTLGF